MIYFPNDSNFLRLDIGNSKVQQYPEVSGNAPPHPRLPIDYFTIHPQGKIIDGSVKLCLWNGEIKGEFETTKGLVKFSSYTQALQPLILLKLKGSDQEDNCEVKWNPLPYSNPRHLYGINRKQESRKIKNFRPNQAPHQDTIQGMPVYIQTLNVGGGTATAWHVDKKAKEQTLTVSIVHGEDVEQVAQEASQVIRKAIRKKPQNLYATHCNWWNNYYQKSYITIPDKKIEQFYWMQLYKVASATRADGALINNQGPWLQETPWAGAWWNLNVQLSYWLCNASNHTDLNISLINTLCNNIDVLANNAPEAYRYNSAGIGRATGQIPEAPVGKPWLTKNEGGPTPEIGLLPWACHNLWLHYRHTMDKQMLKEKLFPLLKRTTNYYIHFIQKDSAGIYHLPYTYSPEYGVAKDCNFDLALLKWSCSTLIEICNILSIDDPLLSTWKDINNHLVPFPMDDNGFMIGAEAPYNYSHRHYSHLMMIYPLYLVNIEQEGATEIIEKSVEHWHSFTNGWLAGYSYTGASSMYSAINNGDKALEHLQKLFQRYVLPNTLYKEDGPVIETPLSGAQSLLDMLLQSWGGKIRVFPALPSQWKNVEFHNLLAEGGFEVSSKQVDGELEYIKIKSLAGEPCVVKLNDNSLHNIKSIKPIKYQ